MPCLAMRHQRLRIRVNQLPPVIFPSPADEPLPLILIGAGRMLRLRNVRLANAASLAVCLQLAPGGRAWLLKVNAWEAAACLNPIWT